MEDGKMNKWHVQEVHKHISKILRDLDPETDKELIAQNQKYYNYYKALFYEIQIEELEKQITDATYELEKLRAKK